MLEEKLDQPNLYEVICLISVLSYQLFWKWVYPIC